MNLKKISAANFVAIVVFSLIVYGCGKEENPAVKSSKTVAHTEELGHVPVPPISAGSGEVSGVVLATMNSGGYTYVELETKDGKVWAAGPQTEIKVGANVAFSQGSLMKGFNSKTLNKTFDSIYFVGSFTVEGKVATPPVSQYGKGPGGQSPPHSMPSPSLGGHSLTGGHGQGAANAVEPPQKGDIQKVDGGYTFQELFKERMALKDKKVKMRGKVIKFTPGIMGKNWLHIVDGTEEPGQKDLTVTTDQTVEIGKTVIAEGQLRVDKDIGRGYFFQVLLEDAVLTIE